MDGLLTDLATSDVQLQDRRFSSTKYKSHRFNPEAVASALD
jgi:hypothetical protein